LETAEPFSEQLNVLHSLIKDPENITKPKQNKSESKTQMKATKSTIIEPTTTKLTTNGSDVVLEKDEDKKEVE
jgi:hypothetical protein